MEDNNQLLNIMLLKGMSEEETSRQINKLAEVVSLRALQILGVKDEKLTDPNSYKLLAGEFSKEEFESAWDNAKEEVVPDYLKAIGIN